jgi:hypothetical protein
MQMKRASLALMATVFVTSAEAFPPRDASYFCEVELSGGLAFDNSSGRWQSTTFIPSGKFVLNLKFLRSRMRKDFFDKDEPVNDYTVTMTNAGENHANPCQQYGGEAADGISMGEWNTPFDVPLPYRIISSALERTASWLLTWLAT